MIEWHRHWLTCLNEQVKDSQWTDAEKCELRRLIERRSQLLHELEQATDFDVLHHMKQDVERGQEEVETTFRLFKELAKRRMGVEGAKRVFGERFFNDTPDPLMRLSTMGSGAATKRKR
jgi:hypothetical protein